MLVGRPAKSRLLSKQIPLAVASCSAEAFAILSSSMATTQARALSRYISTSPARSSLTSAMASGVAKWRLTALRLLPIVLEILFVDQPAADRVAACCCCSVVSGSPPLRVLCGARTCLRLGGAAGVGGRVVLPVPVITAYHTTWCPQPILGCARRR